MVPEKPMIVVLSGPNDKKFSWLSVGWHTVEQSDLRGLGDGAARL